MNEPPTIVFEDPETREVWRKYRNSGVEDIIGCYSLCHAMFAFVKSGMADRVVAERFVSRTYLTGNVDEHLGSHLLKYLAIKGMLESLNDTYKLTELGESLLCDVSRAQLGFYREAYGPVLEEMSALLVGQKRYGVEVSRNGAALSAHSAVLFHTFHTPIVLQAIRDLGATQVLDLGCGAGRSLIDACHRDPQFRGIGLDISEDAIALAKDLSLREGVADRLEFVVADAFQPKTWPAICARADALMAVGVMHEHFRDGEQAVIRLLDSFADVLRSGCKGLLLGEPELLYDTKENDPDFYLAHIFTNQGFPVRCDDWCSLFEKSHLRCRRILRRIGYGPRLVFFDLTAASK